MQVAILGILSLLVIIQLPLKNGRRAALFLGIAFVHLLTIMEDPLLSQIGTLLRFPIWVVGILYSLTISPAAKKAHPPSASYRVYLSLLVAFLLWSALSLIWTVNRVDTIVKVLNFALIVTFLHLNVTRYWNGDVRLALNDLKVLINAVLFVIVLSVAFTLPDVSTSLTGSIRYQGLFHNPNTLAALSATCFFPTLQFYFRDRQGILRLLPLILLVSLFLSGSRSSTLALVVAGLVTLLVYVLRNIGYLKVFVPAVFLCSLPLSIAYLVWQLGRRQESEAAAPLLPRQFNVEVSETLFNGRELLWQTGLRIFIENPVIGYGLNGTRTVLDRMYSAGLYSGQPRQLHNSYVEILVDLGLVGGVIFCFILTLLVIRFAQGIQNIPLIRAAFLVPLIISLSESALFGLASIVATMFWIFAVLLFVTDEPRDSIDRETTPASYKSHRNRST